MKESPSSTLSIFWLSNSPNSSPTEDLVSDAAVYKQHTKDVSK